jgi:hypothetical protein
MGFTPEAIAQASRQPELTEIARSGPWVVYRVEASDLVVPLEVQPIVVTGRSDDAAVLSRVGDAKERWLEVGTSWFQSPADWPALPAADGPAEWQRVRVAVDLDRRIGEPDETSRRVDVVVPSEPVDVVRTSPVRVSNVVQQRSSLTFSVDSVGIPILVRMSYFPNWNVEGADGPFRVAPNMMVVVPTQTDVTLTFGWSWLDVAAYMLSLIGVAIVARWGLRVVSARRTTGRVSDN